MQNNNKTERQNIKTDLATQTAEALEKIQADNTTENVLTITPTDLSGVITNAELTGITSRCHVGFVIATRESIANWDYSGKSEVSKSDYVSAIEIQTGFNMSVIQEYSATIGYWVFQVARPISLAKYGSNAKDYRLLKSLHADLVKRGVDGEKFTIGETEHECSKIANKLKSDPKAINSLFGFKKSAKVADAAKALKRVLKGDPIEETKTENNESGLVVPDSFGGKLTDSEKIHDSEIVSLVLALRKDSDSLQNVIDALKLKHSELYGKTFADMRSEKELAKASE